jgi:hypothetical protein
MDREREADRRRLPVGYWLIREPTLPSVTPQERPPATVATCPFACSREGKEIHLCLSQRNMPVMVGLEFAISYCTGERYRHCARFSDAAAVAGVITPSDGPRPTQMTVERPIIIRLAQGAPVPVQHDAFAHAGNRRSVKPPPFDGLVEAPPSKGNGANGSVQNSNSAEVREHSQPRVPEPTTSAIIDGTRIYLAPDAEPEHRHGIRLVWAKVVQLLVGALLALCAVVLAVWLGLGQAGSSSPPSSAHRASANPRVNLVHFNAPRAPARTWSFVLPHAPAGRFLLSLHNSNLQDVDAVVQATGSLPTRIRVPARGSAELDLGHARGELTIHAAAPILPQVIQVAGTKVTSLRGTMLPSGRTKKP